MCNLLGFDLGADLLAPQDDNKKGFWENAVLVGLHERIFDELGVHWSDSIPFEDDWMTLRPIAELSRELAAACESQFSGSDHWCIKDPRACRLFPLWRVICRDLGVQSKVLMMFRHPAAVATSIGRRNNISQQDALLAWLKYNLDAIEASVDSPRVFVSFESFQSNWKNVAKKIEASLQIEWPISLEDGQAEMDLFFDSSMISCSADVPMEAAEHIKSWCIDLYEALKAAELGDFDRAEPVFARIQSEFCDWQKASYVATQTIRNIRKQNTHLAHVEADLITQKEIVSERNVWIEKLKAETEDKASQIVHLQADVFQLHERAEELALVLNSLSWRITRPLRVLKRLVKRTITPIPHKTFSFCRLVYRRLPLPHSRKLILRGLFFRVLTMLRVLGGGKVSNLIKRRSAPNRLDRKIDFRFVEYRLPKVSIIVPVFNEVHYTINCLRSIARCMPNVTFEIIVADDLSTDDTSTIMTEVPGIRYVRNFKNLGFLRNCNNAATLARGEYLYFLNNDTQVLPGFLDELVRTFEENDDVGLAGSKLIFGDGMLQEAGGIIWEDASGWNFGRGEDPDAPEYNSLRDVDYCSGCSILIRKSLWDEIGGFDELFVPAYYEDTDLAFQVRMRGLRTVYQPLSAIVHFEGVSSGTDITSGVKSYQIKNQAKFQEKWHKQLYSHGDAKNLQDAIDRSIKRHVLIIDSVTPTPKQDAGSLRTYNMIRMLINLGSKVSFIPEDNIAYMQDVTPDLQRMGVECLYYPYITSVQRYLRSNAQKFDAIFLERGPVASKYIDTIKDVAPDVPILFDTHDLHYLRIARQAEVERSNSLKAEAESMKAIEYDVMRRSDCTIVVSEFEKQVVDHEMPELRTEILPLFIESEPLEMPFEQRSGILFIGGFRHQPNGDAVHHFVRDIWPLIKSKIPDMRFHIIGADVPADIHALATHDIIVEGFVPDLTPLFSECRLSIAPLRFGAGVKGKIGTSLAYGLPSVISTIAQEGSGLVSGEHVLVADQPEDFAEQVIRLYRDQSLWESLAENGVKFIEDNYSFAINQKRIAALLDEFAPLGISEGQHAELELESASPTTIHAAELQSDRV